MPGKQSAKRAGRVRYRVTTAGWIFLLISLTVGAAASRTQASLLYVLFGGALGTILVSGLMARWTISSLELRRNVPLRIWQNQTVHFGYYLRNGRSFGSSLGVHVEEIAPVGIDSAAGYCVHLPAESVFRAGARFAGRRRGRIRLGAARVSTTFPFGLILAARKIPLQADVVVWPGRGKLTRHLLHVGAVASSSAAPSPASGGQDEFFGLREYRPDDNPRWIHWRRSATRAQPVVREMSKPLPEVLWVILDARPGERARAAGEARERRIRFAGTLIDYAFSRGYKVGLALAAGGKAAVYEPACGLGQRTALLDALADINGEANLPISETVRRLRRGLLQQAQVIALTSEADPLQTAADLQPLRATCRHLTVIDDNRLPTVFQDNPLAGAEED